MGVMGTGIAGRISKAYPRVLARCRMVNPRRKLGGYVATLVRTPYGPKMIMNLYGQYRYGRDQQYTDYKAVESALHNAKEFLKCHFHDKLPVQFGIPDHMGCNNAGGDWSEVEKILDRLFSDDRDIVLHIVTP
jgi:O-acetyl-ADP-ribose deacetylase (regulator of RNase III)